MKLLRNNPRVNYVLATWSGIRRGGATYGNRTFQHLHYLNRFKNNLSQVTVGWPNNPNELPEYVKFMEGLESLKNGVPIVLERMVNQGRSYGQYSKIFDKYRDQFDYYIFLEDDYVPAIDNFDLKMIRMFEKSHFEENCGFLCGMVKPVKFRSRRDGPLHAAISWGLSSFKVLSDVWEKEGMLPHDQGEYRSGQNIFSWGFMNSGYKLNDVMKEYCVPYWSRRVERWGNKDKPYLFVPIELALSSQKMGPIASAPFSPKVDKNRLI